MVRVYCGKSGHLKGLISGEILDMVVASGRTKKDKEGRLVSSDNFECGTGDVKVVVLEGDIFLL